MFSLLESHDIIHEPFESGYLNSGMSRIDDMLLKGR